MKKIVVSLVILIVLACSGSHSPTEPYLSAKLQAKVTESGTQAAIVGAIVEVGQGDSTAVAYTARTDETGTADIAVQPGTYWIRVLPPAGFTYGFSGVPVARLNVGAGGTAGVAVSLVRG